MTSETDPVDAYEQAARAETARIMALYGESKRYTVVRVDGERGEDQDNWPASATDWQRREEEARQREEGEVI